MQRFFAIMLATLWLAAGLAVPADAESTVLQSVTLQRRITDGNAVGRAD